MIFENAVLALDRTNNVTVLSLQEFMKEVEPFQLPNQVKLLRLSLFVNFILFLFFNLIFLKIKNKKLLKTYAKHKKHPTL